MEGSVRLNNPDTTFYYIEFYGLDPNNIPKEPYELFFGRWVGILYYIVHHIYVTFYDEILDYKRTKRFNSKVITENQKIYW